jgi:YebC/PmpR family DNA-binding regulatory protein
MSGHSKWKTIQHKKGAADAKRGKVFSKLSKELMVAARKGSDPSANPTLRTVIQKAKAANMPADNVNRAIKKGAGELEGVIFEEICYECFVGGIALIVQGLTDNKNRAASEIRHIFGRFNTDFAISGSVMRQFVRKGQIIVDAATVEEDKLMEIVLNAGAEDMVKDGDSFEVVTDPASFADVSEALEKAGIKTISAEVSLIPLAQTKVTDKAKAQSVLKFVADLEDNDDVQNVYTNMDIDDSILGELEKAE